MLTDSFSISGVGGDEWYGSGRIGGNRIHTKLLSMRLRRRDHDVYCEGFMIKKTKQK